MVGTTFVMWRTMCSGHCMWARASSPSRSYSISRGTISGWLARSASSPPIWRCCFCWVDSTSMASTWSCFWRSWRRWCMCCHCSRSWSLASAWHSACCDHFHRWVGEELSCRNGTIDLGSESVESARSVQNHAEDGDNDARRTRLWTFLYWGWSRSPFLNNELDHATSIRSDYAYPADESIGGSGDRWSDADPTECSTETAGYSSMIWIRGEALVWCIRIFYAGPNPHQPGKEDTQSFDESLDEERSDFLCKQRRV